MLEREIAERLLAEKWGESIQLTDPETLRENRCFSFRVAASDRQVIVKRALDNRDALLAEWASLQFLSEVAPDEGPAFYGGDPETCLIVYEHLGSGPSLVEPLMGDDPAAAQQALILHAEAVARLHNATAGKEARFDEIRRSLGPLPEKRDGQGWGDLATLKPQMVEGFAKLGLEVRASFWDDYDQLTQIIHQPGPYRAFTHNDSCPDNCRIVDGRVRLFDFEVAGYHHRLLDTAYARLGMPHCYLANAVPSDIVAATEAAYRQACRLDDDQFGKEMVHACFYWLVSNGIWRLADRLDQDDFTWGISTWRQRVFYRLEVLALTCDEFGWMSAVGEAARETVGRLRGRWAVEPMSVYPALRGC